MTTLHFLRNVGISIGFHVGGFLAISSSLHAEPAKDPSPITVQFIPIADPPSTADRPSLEEILPPPASPPQRRRKQRGGSLARATRPRPQEAITPPPSKPEEPAPGEPATAEVLADSEGDPSGGINDGVLDERADSVGGADSENGSGTSDAVPAKFTPSRLLPESLVRPAYPGRARHAGLEGRVLLRVRVGMEGDVESVRVIRTDDDEMSDAAIDAVKRWKFAPARRGEQAVASWVNVPMEFELH